MSGMLTHPAVNALDTLPRVTDLSQAPADAIRVLAEGRDIALPSPLFIDASQKLPEASLEIASRTSSWTDPAYLARLHNVLLTGHRDLLTQDGLYLADLWNQAGLHSRPPALLEDGEGGWRHGSAMTFAERIEESCGLLFFHSASGDNHSHWLLQTLPQLRLYEQAGIRPQKLVVQPNIRPYQRETLRLLGWHDADILVRAPDRPLVFRELYAGYVDGGLPPDPTLYDRLRAACPRVPGSPEKLYISRRDARDVRRFLNEEQLIARVLELGYTVVVPGRLSLAEEVALFRGARVICGPLGAGLYNALFADPGATMIALGDPHYVMTWFAQTAALRGHRHGWMFGVSFDSVEPAYGGTHNNWICDVAQVAARLAAL